MTHKVFHIHVKDWATYIRASVVYTLQIQRYHPGTKEESQNAWIRRIHIC